MRVRTTLLFVSIFSSLSSAGNLPIGAFPFTANVTAAYTGFLPDGNAPNVQINGSSISWGTAAPGSLPSSVLVNPLLGTTGCVGTQCVPGPNLPGFFNGLPGVFPIATITYHNGEILAGTGISNASFLATLVNPLNPQVNGKVATATMPTVSTPNNCAPQPRCAADYLWFVNSNGFVTNAFFVLEGQTAVATLYGSIIDPPDGTQLEIVGFTTSDPNGFTSASSIPEPAPASLVAFELLLLCVGLTIRLSGFGAS